MLITFSVIVRNLLLWLCASIPCAEALTFCTALMRALGDMFPGDSGKCSRGTVRHVPGGQWDMFPGDSGKCSRWTVGHVPGGQWDMFPGDSGHVPRGQWTCSQEIVGTVPGGQ